MKVKSYIFSTKSLSRRRKTQPQTSTQKMVDDLLSGQATALERETDQLVYKLYNLTDDEIAIIESDKNNGEILC